MLIECEVKDMDILKQSTATIITIFMVSSVDHLSGKTGLGSALTVYLAKSGTGFSAITPVVTELAYGWYSITLTSTHTNTLGSLLLHVTGSGADALDKEYKVVTNTFDSLVNSVWQYTDRTLTYSQNNILSVNAAELGITRGDTFVYVFEDLDLTDYDNVFFTLKVNYKDSDCDAILQIDEATGGLIVNGQKPTDPTLCDLTINNDKTTATLTIDASVTKNLPYSDNLFVYDLQMVTDQDVVVTPLIGEACVIRDVTRRIV